MASRKEEKERRREERLSWEREQHEQSRRRRLYSIVAGGVLVLAAAAAIVVAVTAGGGDDPGGGGDSKELIVTAADPPAQKTDDLVQAAKAADCKLTNPPIEGSTHLEPDAKTPNYKTNPPTSGNHDPVPATDGAYADAPNIKNLVHSLEHGRIEIQFDPEIPERRLAELKGLFDEDEYHLFLVPNETKMSGQLAVVAWGHLALCKRITDETFDVIRAFTTRYRDKGPEFVP